SLSPLPSLLPYTTLFRSLCPPGALSSPSFSPAADSSGSGESSSPASASCIFASSSICSSCQDEHPHSSRHTVSKSTKYTLLFLRSEEHTSELQSRFDLVC